MYFGLLNNNYIDVVARKCIGLGYYKAESAQTSRGLECRDDVAAGSCTSDVISAQLFRLLLAARYQRHNFMVYMALLKKQSTTSE